eukprot:2288043-Rhodomonas_salina.2
MAASTQTLWSSPGASAIALPRATLRTAGGRSLALQPLQTGFPPVPLPLLPLEHCRLSLALCSGCGSLALPLSSPQYVTGSSDADDKWTPSSCPAPPGTLPDGLASGPGRPLVPPRVAALVV